MSTPEDDPDYQRFIEWWRGNTWTIQRSSDSRRELAWDAWKAAQEGIDERAAKVEAKVEARIAEFEATRDTLKADLSIERKVSWQHLQDGLRHEADAKRWAFVLDRFFKRQVHLEYSGKLKSGDWYLNSHSMAGETPTEAIDDLMSKEIKL